MNRHTILVSGIRIRRDFRRRVAASLLAAAWLFCTACSREKPEDQPTISVQVAAVEKTEIRHVIETQAILFPLQQAAIVPKISAPVQKFLVKRASAVRQGHIL